MTKRLFLSTLGGCGLLLLGGCAGTGGGPAGTASPESFLRTGAQVAVVEFFDMYCPTCQAMAPKVNELHDLVQRRGLDGKIAFYAVGWTNTATEADLYRSRFRVRFPVIPDHDRAISNRYGDFRPPVLLVLRREGGTWKEIHRVKHWSGSPEEFLAKIWNDGAS